MCNCNVRIKVSCNTTPRRTRIKTAYIVYIRVGRRWESTTCEAFEFHTAVDIACDNLRVYRGTAKGYILPLGKHYYSQPKAFDGYSYSVLDVPREEQF